MIKVKDGVMGGSRFEFQCGQKGKKKSLSIKKMFDNYMMVLDSMCY